ncbi:MAG: YopX family protein [Firmicutes bacterium]|nr:YopX family protein [Bacillota bacterium]
MREIKFRGKRVDTKEWVYGVPFGKYMIHRMTTAYYDDEVPMSGYPEFDYIEVIPETIGQYTGLKDKNGVEIYKGDIVAGVAYSFDRKGVIVWINELAGFGVKYLGRDTPTAWEESSILKNIKNNNYHFAAEIIGNIHDDPELGGKHND